MRQNIVALMTYPVPTVVPTDVVLPSRSTVDRCMGLLPSRGSEHDPVEGLHQS